MPDRDPASIAKRIEQEQAARQQAEKKANLTHQGNLGHLVHTPEGPVTVNKGSVAIYRRQPPARSQTGGQ
jgi:hypothetical protein